MEAVTQANQATIRPDLRRFFTPGPRSQAIAGYLFTVFVCLAVLTQVMRLWRADWHVPFCGGYSWDGLAISTLIKGMMENGWYLHNPSVGAPGGLDMHDYPMTDNLHFAVLKLFALLFRDYAVAYNLFVLLTFPLTAFTSQVVLRRFGLSWPASVLGSLLFTFLPYHFFRGMTGHVFLAAYYMVPLVVLVCLWIYRDGTLMAKPSRLAVAVLVAALVSSGAVYYSFFSCFFLLVSGVASSSWHRRLAPLGWACLLVACISLGAVLNLLPTFVYQHQHGPNREAGVRKAMEAEYYGLKLTQLVLPLAVHRVKWLRQLKQHYLAQGMPAGGEGWSTLGLVSVAGFLVLLGALLPRRRHAQAPSLLGGLAVLNVFALLLAAIGGGSSLFAVFVTPQIRCYDRICVFIGFFSLCAISGLLDRVGSRWGGSLTGRWGYGLLVLGVGTLGVLDQTANEFPFVPPYADFKKQFINDAALVRAIEARLPAGSLVYQLPHQTYPEAGPVQRLSDYEHFRAYLHSQNLRWSYGSIRGREGARWLDLVATKPPEELVRFLAFADFAGIYLDRRGYPEGDQVVEKALGRLLAQTPLESEDGTLAFFDLTGYRDRLRQQYASATWERLHERALHPVLLEWDHGFYSPESSGRWCEEDGEVVLENSSGDPRPVHLELKCMTSFMQPARLTLAGELASGEYSVNMDGRTVALDLVVPPGRHVLHLTCDGKKIKPGDGRTLVFKVYEWKLSEPE